MGKKFKRLFGPICSFENLLTASRKARLGKKHRDEAAAFEFDLEKNLFLLHDELASGAFAFSGYRQFIIHEPKERLICAAPYKDRVVHHAIANVVEPILDRAMVDQSYACRKEKGSHRAVEAALQYCGIYPWVLKIDVQKYFFRIDHELLLCKIGKKIQDDKVLLLLKNLLSTYQSAVEYRSPDWQGNAQGLPIGNLTSQIFANFFLDSIDRCIGRKLNHGRFLRYMDDVVVFGESKEQLTSIRGEIEQELRHIHLEVHPKKSQCMPVKNGVHFLGFTLRNNSKKIRRENLQRFKKKMKVNAQKFNQNMMTFRDLLSSLNGWLGYADQERNEKFIEEVLSSLKITPPEKEYYFTFCLSGTS